MKNKAPDELPATMCLSFSVYFIGEGGVFCKTFRFGRSVARFEARTSLQRFPPLGAVTEGHLGSPSPHAPSLKGARVRPPPPPQTDVPPTPGCVCAPYVCLSPEPYPT